MNDDSELMRRLGLDFDALDSGCCGMAGSFGFERRKYEVSAEIGELVLLREVRAADRAAMVVTNGYSCREQIKQGAGREALHIAELLQSAIMQKFSPRPRLHHLERVDRPLERS